MTYVKPEINIIEFDTEDIIVTSGLSDGGGYGGTGGYDLTENIDEP